MSNQVSMTTGVDFDSTLSLTEITKLDLSWLNENSIIDPQLSLLPPAGTAIKIGTSSTGTGNIGGLTTATVPNQNLGSNPHSSQNWGVGINDILVTRSELQRSLDEQLKPIMNRLAILDQPDPRVLEKYESLRTAYDHYRTLEALMFDEIERIKNE